MVIIEQPNGINFLGSLPNLVVKSTADVTISGRGEDWEGGVVRRLSSETYSPSPAGQVEVRLKDVLKYLFDFELKRIPSGITHSLNMLEVYLQVSNGTTTSSVNFFVINGKISYVEDIGFIGKGFMNIHGQIKRTALESIETLNLYQAAPGTPVLCKCHIYGAEEPAIVTIGIVPIYSWLCTVAVDFRAILSTFPSGTRLIAADVCIEQDDFAAQRYVFDDPGRYDDEFYFENCLGGIELIRFTGEKQDKRSYQSLTAQQYDETLDYDNEVSVGFSKNTGYLATPSDREFARDFMRSDNRFHVVGDELKRIHITKGEIESMSFTLSSYVFEFSYPQEDVFQLLRTMCCLPENLEGGVEVDMDSDLYKLKLLLDKLQREFDEHKALSNQSFTELRELIVSIMVNLITINDSTPSPIKVYSSQKIEAILQQLANLWPFGTLGYNVRIKDLFNMTATNTQARQIVPMVACAGTLDKQRYDGEPLIRYGPISWDAVPIGGIGLGWKITHKLGHTNYIFNGNAHYTTAEGGTGYRAATVMIREKNDKYIEVFCALGNGSEPEVDLKVDFTIFTFSDPRFK